MKKRMLAALLALVMLVSVMPAALAEDTPVAKIGETPYTNIDTAIAEAADGATIVLLTDVAPAKTFYKSLTFTGGHTMTYNVYGWRYNGNLTFDGANLVVNSDENRVAADNVEAAGWAAMILNGSIKATNGANITFEFDSTCGTNCAVYMNENGRCTITVENGSSFKIFGHNTKGVAGQGIQLGKTANTGIWVTGGSTFLIDGTNRGYVNSPVVYVENSNLTVQNCTSNGSNGGKFTAINSTINFLDNAVLGLSTDDAIIEKSALNLNGNGACGWASGNSLKVDGTSIINVLENGYRYKGYEALRIRGTADFEDGAVVNIKNNAQTGLYAQHYVLKSKWSDVDRPAVVNFGKVKLTITNNGAHSATYGGGIWNQGTINLPMDAVIYNNHASTAGDDIYSNDNSSWSFPGYPGFTYEKDDVSITFGDVGTDWVLDDCNHMIDGWYEDGLEGDAPLRWNVHATETAKHVVKKNSGTYTEAIAYKAAHGEEYYEPDENPIADYILPALWLNTKDHYSYLIGYADGTVKPEGKITRAEVATIFFRLLTDDARAKFWSSTNDYTDVPADKWYNNAISTLSNMGVIGGYADGTFRPDAPISRAEFAKIAVSFSNVADLSYRGYFADVKESDWFSGFVAAAKDAGLIEGYNDGTFQPEKAITRAEVCTIVNRTLGRKPSASHMKISDRIDWPDVSVTDWYYEAIMEATNSHTYQMGQRVETWNDKLPQRDWALLETGWANAYTGNGGDVH